jgi:hypothetical protein
MVLDERALWTLEDVAEYLQVSPRQVYSYRIKPGFPPVVDLPGGRSPRFHAGKVMAWALSHESQNIPDAA